jgi:ABC-type glycerol-3-phosphate transport system permease component
MRERRRAAILRLLFLLAVGALVAMPLYWMTVSAFKSDVEISRPEVTFWPEEVRWDNFAEIWRRFAVPARNSLIVSGACTVLIVFFSTLAGYALAKKHFVGRRMLLMVLIATMLIPPAVLIVPLYCIIASLGLVNTLTGLVLPFAVTAFGIFLMRQFAAEIPDSLLESARIDGASEWMIFRRVAVPLLKPAMAVLAIIEFVNNWNSFAVPLVLIASPEKETLQLALAGLLTADVVPWSKVMAGTVLTILPIVVICLVFQRWIIGSIMKGAVKG